MATANLSAAPRSETGKGVARKLRASAQIPAVIYGHNREAMPLTLDARELERLLDKVAYQSTVIELAIAGHPMAKTLVREIQRHPFKKQILHVDFQELVAGEFVTVKVPLQFHGVPDGVRIGGGILDQILHEIEVTCDPSNIPHHVVVEVTALTIGHSIHAGDLTLPEGVTLVSDASATLCVCAAPKVAEAAPAADAVAEPELIRKTKAEEDAEKK